MTSRISHSLLFNLSPNAYMVLDRDLVFVDANDAYLQATGRTRAELVGRPLFVAFPGNPADPADTSVAQLRDSFERVLRERAPHHLALIRYAIPVEQDGATVFEERYWSATNLPIFDDHGEVSGILQHTVDVTELQRLRQVARARAGEIEGGLFRRAQAVQARHDRLDEQRRHLQQLFDQAPGFIAGLRGPLHVFEVANQAYHQLVGGRELIGKTVREALPEVAGQGFIDLLDHVYASGEPHVGRGVRVLLRRTADEAEERYVDFIFQPVIESDGSVSGIAVQGHDVTEQHRAEQDRERYRTRLEALLQERTEALSASVAEHARTRAQLEHVQRLEALGRLTGGVAHDFNNLLQVMTNALLLLEAALAGDAKSQRWIGMARNAVDSGSRLTRQLLAFARRQPLKPQAVDVGRLLRDREDLLQRTLGEAIEIDIDAPEPLWTVAADLGQLENVILNLAINARDAMGGRGSLRLAASNATLGPTEVDIEDGQLPGRYVRLEVSDSGPGMPAAVRARAFEPFFTTKPPGQGTGLGLSMVWGFVKQSGGHVRIDSEPGQGTRVLIELPVAERPHAPGEVQPPVREDPASGGGETILVVEDEPAVLETTAEALSAVGYRVLTAHDGASALEVVARGERIDLLFSDVVMPGPVASAELARRAREAVPGLQVLFASGYAEEAAVHGGRLNPDVPLLNKPYTRDQLTQRIRQLLRRA